MSDLRACVPEWCESGREPHDDVCDNAPMAPMTKREFVVAQVSAASQAVDAYAFMLADGHDAEDGKDTALEEVREASTCWAGIGSCGRGWCHHG